MKEHTSNVFLKLSFHYNWEEDILDSVPDGSQQSSAKKNILATAILCETVYGTTMSFVILF